METNGDEATATDSKRRNKQPEAGWRGTVGMGVCRDAGARLGPGEAGGKGHGAVSRALSADQGTATTCCHHRSLGTLLAQPHGCAALPEHTAHRLSWTSDGESQTRLIWLFKEFIQFSGPRPAREGEETRPARSSLTKTHLPGSRLQRELSVLILWVSFPSMRTRWLLPSSTATRIAPLLISTDTWKHREREKITRQVPACPRAKLGRGVKCTCWG